MLNFMEPWVGSVVPSLESCSPLRLGLGNIPGVDIGGDMNGYFLLPSVAVWIRDGKFNITHHGSVSDNFIAILPVLLAHENRTTRESFPSIARITTLAGVSSTSASDFLRELDKSGWLQIIRKSIPGGLTQHVYKMRYTPYGPESISTDWIRIDKDMVLERVWAVMPPSVRRIYLIFRANGLREWCADGSWVPGADEGFDPEATCQFVPAEYWEPRYLQETSGLAQSTIREAKAWLWKAQLLKPTDDGQEPGIMMPFKPQMQAPKIIESLAKPRRRSDSERNISQPSGHTIRSIRQMRRKAVTGKQAKTSPVDKV